MCKIDLPRKNMVIERERAQKRRGERLLGISTHTHLHNHTCAEPHRCTHSHAGRSRGKSAGLGGMEKRKKLSLLLSSSTSH